MQNTIHSLELVAEKTSSLRPQRPHIQQHSLFLLSFVRSFVRPSDPRIISFKMWSHYYLYTNVRDIWIIIPCAWTSIIIVNKKKLYERSEKKMGTDRDTPFPQRERKNEKSWFARDKPWKVCYIWMRRVESWMDRLRSVVPEVIVEMNRTQAIGFYFFFLCPSISVGTYVILGIYWV